MKSSQKDLKKDIISTWGVKFFISTKKYVLYVLYDSHDIRKHMMPSLWRYDLCVVQMLKKYDVYFTMYILPCNFFH